MHFTQLTAVLFLAASVGMATPLPAAEANDLTSRTPEKEISNAPAMKKRTFWLPWLHHHDHFDFDDDDDDDRRCGGFYTWWGGAGGCENDDDDFYRKGK